MVMESSQHESPVSNRKSIHLMILENPTDVISSRMNNIFCVLNFWLSISINSIVLFRYKNKMLLLSSNYLLKVFTKYLSGKYLVFLILGKSILE